MKAYKLSWITNCNAKVVTVRAVTTFRYYKIEDGLQAV